MLFEPNPAMPGSVDRHDRKFATSISNLFSSAFGIPKWVDFSDDWDFNPSCISFFSSRTMYVMISFFDMAKIDRDVSVVYSSFNQCLILTLLLHVYCTEVEINSIRKCKDCDE